MKRTAKKITKDALNKLIGYVGLKITSNKEQRSFKDYLDLEDIVKGAEKTGMKVSDYIEKKYKLSGTSQRTIERLKDLGVYDDPIKRICEIGPGSGRYLEKTISISNPEYYEIYETASEWAKWLEKNYNVHSQICDGKTLKGTLSNSIDLVQAHKIFNGIPFITTCKYFKEMARVIKDGGKIIFDVFTEDCMNEAILEKWFEEDMDKWSWIPHIMPKNYVIEFFKRRNISFVDSFFIPQTPGRTECLVFKK